MQAYNFKNADIHQICICIYLYMYMYINMYMYIFIYVYVYIYMYRYIYIFLCIYLYSYIYIYIFLIIYIYVYLFIHTHIYILYSSSVNWFSFFILFNVRKTPHEICYQLVSNSWNFLLKSFSNGIKLSQFLFKYSNSRLKLFLWVCLSSYSIQGLTIFYFHFPLIISNFLPFIHMCIYIHIYMYTNSISTEVFKNVYNIISK